MTNSYSPYGALTQLQMLWKKRFPVNFPELCLLLKTGCREHQKRVWQREEEKNGFLARNSTTTQTANDKTINIIHNSVPERSLPLCSAAAHNQPHINQNSQCFPDKNWMTQKLLLSCFPLIKSGLLSKGATHSPYLILALCYSHNYWSLQSALNKHFFLLWSKGQILSLNALLPITPGTWLHSLHGRNSV